MKIVERLLIIILNDQIDDRQKICSRDQQFKGHNSVGWLARLPAE